MSATEPVADVLVVGSGAGGGALSWRLAEAGIDVVCLERGDWTDPAAYPATTPDWESRRVRDFHPNPNIRGRDTDYPIDESTTPIKPLMFSAVGGSTIFWTAHNPRFHPSDFRVKTLDGVADDWPLSYEELAPHYELNDRMIGIAGINGDPAMPEREPRQVPPLPLGKGADRLVDAFDRLGLPLVASRLGRLDEGLRRAYGVQQLRAVRARLHTRRQGLEQHHLLAQGARPRRADHHPRGRARDHNRRAGARHRRHLSRR